jgi:hypothetical protein
VRIDGVRSWDEEFVGASVVSFETGGSVFVFLIFGELVGDLLRCVGFGFGLSLLLSTRLTGYIGQRAAVLCPRGRGCDDEQQESDQHCELAADLSVSDD